MLAARFGCKEVVELLLQRGAFPGALCQNNRNSALSLAIHYEEQEVVEILLNYCDSYGNTAFMHAVGGYEGYVGYADDSLFRTILDHDKEVNIEATNSNGSTAQLVAALQGNAIAVEMLLKENVNVKAVDKAGWTGLCIMQHGVMRGKSWRC